MTTQVASSVRQCRAKPRSSMSLITRALRRLSTFWALWRARSLGLARLRNNAPRRLLVLCYGNIYRSPFVEALLKTQLQAVAPAMEFRSAGFYPRIGRETPGDFVALSRTYQLDLTGHRSSLVDAALIDWADLVVVMDRHNWEALADFGPPAQDKAVWLGALLEDGPVEIGDPYGRTAAEAGAIAQRLYLASCALAQRLLAVSAERTADA